MRKLRHSPAYNSGGWKLLKPCVTDFWFLIFLFRVGYLLRVSGLSVWLSWMRSRIDRLMLSKIEFKAWKTNEMEVLDFLIRCLAAWWLWMRYRC